MSRRTPPKPNVRTERNWLLTAAFLIACLDAILAIAFSLMAPEDPRIANPLYSQRQAETITIQGIVALVDATVSCMVVIHIMAGILSASIDNFLEAASAKLLQSIFLLLQTGFPTFTRLFMVFILLTLRVVTASMIFRSAFLSGILTARPSRDLPKVILSLLEMSATAPATAAHGYMSSSHRPLTIGIVERLIRWLVPLRDRAVATGMGRRQVVLIACFICAITGFSASLHYWTLVGGQDALLDEAQRQRIETESFSYLTEAAYSVGASVRSVGEASAFLPANATSSSHRVVVVILSGLRYDAFEQQGDGDGAALARWLSRLDPEAALLCKGGAELPSLSTPNVAALLTGLRPETHGLLGNRAAAEQLFSSVFSVLSQLRIPATFVGVPWMVDMVRSSLFPFQGDGSISPSYAAFEDQTMLAGSYDSRREEAFLRALNSSARLVVGQFSKLNSAAYAHGASFADGTAYANAVREKAEFLDRVAQMIASTDTTPVTLVVTSDHGHRSRGGAGGASSEERDVPLLAYRIGSRIGLTPPSSAVGRTNAVQACKQGSHSVIDLASTLTALLGAPVPRHCQGGFIEAFFDTSEADTAGTEGGDTAAVAAGTPQVLERWLWRDLYFQRHAFASTFLLHSDVNRRALLDELDTAPATLSLIDDAQNGDGRAFKQLYEDVQALLLSARNDASGDISMRNQLVAALILILVLTLLILSMQMQTFCNPRIVFIPSRSWWERKDARAAAFTFLLTVGYYVVVLVSFVVFLSLNSFGWASSVVSFREQVFGFLVAAILPGFFAALATSHALVLSYSARSAPMKGGAARLASLLLIDEAQAFANIDMIYLSHFYLLVWSLFAAVIFGVLSSRFSFIIPLIFYNKFIDEAAWDYRFVALTIQLMAFPLITISVFNLYRWPTTKVDTTAMAAINRLKTNKFLLQDTAGNPKLGLGIDEDVALTTGAVSKQRKTSTAGRAQPGFDRGVTGGEDLAGTFEGIHQQILERWREHEDLRIDIQSKARQEVDLQEELDEVVVDLKSNQGQIDAGIKELEMLIVQRFGEMQQLQDRNAEAKDNFAVRNDDGMEPEDGADMSALDPAARRQLRRQRLVDEQRKRIADEERERAETLEQTRSLQAEHGKLLEANGRLQRKIEMCEHTVDETRAAIEDMSLQMTRCRFQQESALATVTGEANYLSEHQYMVQRKASELSTKMLEVEAAISSTNHKLLRVQHANGLATADHRREHEVLTAEVTKLDTWLNEKQNDIRMLYGERLTLRAQLQGALDEVVKAEACVVGYRASVANYIA